MAEPFLSINEASAHTGLPTSVLGHAAALDPPQLASFKVGQHGRRYFRASDLDAFLAEHYTGPPAPQRKRRSRQKVGNK